MPVAVKRRVRSDSRIVLVRGELGSLEAGIELLRAAGVPDPQIIKLHALRVRVEVDENYRLENNEERYRLGFARMLYQTGRISR